MAMLNTIADEIIEKRTSNGKYFLDKNEAGKFYKLFSIGGNLHYKNKGKWLTIDRKLELLSKNIFMARHQQEPVGFNILKKTAFIETVNGTVAFNNWALIGQKAGLKKILAEANWSDYSAGDDGLLIHNIFPGINAEMKVLEGAIKTSFIIHKNLYPDVDKFIFKDHFNITQGSGKLTCTNIKEEHQKADFLINNKPSLKINRAMVYTEKDAALNFLYLDYSVKNNDLSISVDASYLDKYLPSGNVIIDPLVEGTATLAQNAITGSMNCGSTSNYCSYTFMVPTPAMATLTNVSFKWGFYANAPSGQNQGLFSITSGACSTGSIGVVNPAVNTGPGSVSTMGNFNLISSLIPCLPPPSCQSQNVPMELRFYNTYCGAGTGCSDTYVKSNEPLVIKIEGHTLELSDITAPLTICNGSTATLNLKPEFGVPPYTYKWSNGATTNSTGVSPSISTTYTVLVTDNCGNVVTGSTKVTVNPTPIIQSVSNNGPLCAGSQLNLSTPVVPGATYSWTGPNNFTSTNAAPVISGATPSQSGSYAVTISVNGCTSPPVSTNVEISDPVTPAVSINASATVICSGTNIIFTAVPVNGGNTPVYKWLLNGTATGINASTYSNSNLSDDDVVTCIFTSSAGCTTSSTAKSNDIRVKVNPVTIPQISIAANTPATICAGTIVTFTATSANGGISPSYQWILNGIKVGADAVTYSSNTLSDGDIVTCILTSNAICTSSSTVISNIVKFTVFPVLKPQLSIVAGANEICPNTLVVFTATPENGGTNPAYQWRLNGNNVGVNSSSYTNATLNNGDIITCTVTSDATCLTMPTAISNSIIMVVSTPLTPAVNVTASATNICAGTTVTFTAAPVNGGTSPLYQWMLNGKATGVNTSTYSNNTLNNGDVVNCVLTSSIQCLTNLKATSGNIVINVRPILVPAVSISASLTIICSGTPVTFTAVPVNCGASPNYIWQLNGNITGAENKTYTNASLRNGDVVTCKVTTDATGCYTTPVAISNTIAITVNTTPIVSAGKDTTVFKGSSFALKGSALGNIASYQWVPNTYLSNSSTPNPVITPQTTTKYTLHVISADNCEASADVTVHVLTKIVVPNTFTPNDDGINDTWKINGLMDYTGAIIDVYNRFGQLVFHTTAYKQWDGSYMGKPLPASTYYYIINPKNQLPLLSGWVVILR